VAFERADDVVAHPRLLPALNDDGAAGGELHSPVVVSWRLVPSSRRQLSTPIRNYDDVFMPPPARVDDRVWRAAR